MLAYCVVIFQAYFIFMPHLKLQTFNINFLEYQNQHIKRINGGAAQCLFDEFMMFLFFKSSAEVDILKFVNKSAVTRSPKYWILESVEYPNINTYPELDGVRFVGS